MHKINILKAKRLVQRVIVLALLALPFFGIIQTPIAEAATCPQKLVTIAHGKLCKSTNAVTCDKGYAAQYNGTSMVCDKPTAGAGGTGNTTVVSGPVSIGAAADVCGGDIKNKDGTVKSKNASVKTSINLGCRGQGNPIMDATFAIIRFLTTGAGIVLVGSMIYAGIQYTASRGDPQATASAVNRLKANVWALLLFLFGYAILNYIIPGTFLK